MNPVPKPMTGKNAYPMRYPAPDSPKTVNALKLVAAMVKNSRTPGILRPARKNSTRLREETRRKTTAMRSRASRYPSTMASRTDMGPPIRPGLGGLEPVA